MLCLTDVDTVTLFLINVQQYRGGNNTVFEWRLESIGRNVDLAEGLNRRDMNLYNVESDVKHNVIDGLMFYAVGADW